MLRVKRQPRLRRDVDVAHEGSFFENAALVVAQDLSDATEFINETCDSGVGGTHHWTPVFDASKDGVVDLMPSLLDCAEQYINPVRTGDLADKLKCFLIFENRRRHRALRPDH